MGTSWHENELTWVQVDLYSIYIVLKSKVHFKIESTGIFIIIYRTNVSDKTQSFIMKCETSEYKNGIGYE